MKKPNRTPEEEAELLEAYREATREDLFAFVLWQSGTSPFGELSAIPRTEEETENSVNNDNGHTKH